MKKLYSSIKLRLQGRLFQSIYLFVVIFNLQKLGHIPDGLSTKGRSQVKATDATIDIRGPEKLVSLQRVARLDFCATSPIVN